MGNDQRVLGWARARLRGFRFQGVHPVHGKGPTDKGLAGKGLSLPDRRRQHVGNEKYQKPSGWESMICSLKASDTAVHFYRVAMAF